jgi:hypothetical protein
VLDLGGQELLEAPVIGQTGQLVSDRLAMHLEMEFYVLKRRSGLDPSELGTSRSSSVNA